MTTDSIRLSKVAKELNVGLTNLVDCFARYGHEIDSSLNTKITIEQYELLRKEYATEAEILEVAKTLNSKEDDKSQTNANTREKSRMHIDSFKTKTDDEILRFLFNYWKIDGMPNPDGSFRVVASYQKAGKDKNGFDCGYFVNIRNLNGDILYYPFRLGKISIYTPHNDFYEKEELWEIVVKLNNKEKYRQDNPFSLRLADRFVDRPKNAFVDRLEKEKLIRALFEETGTTERDAKIEANALRSIMGDLYSEGNERFIFELLQNADDQPQDDQQLVSVKLKALSEHLIFTHSGKPFSKEDVESISSIGDSTKKDDSQKTGYKGIGFKSVFSGAETVFIDSGAFSFAFDKYSPVYKGETNMDEIPWQLKPIWEERYRLPEEVALDSDYLNCPVGIALQIGAEKLDTYKAKIQELFAEPRFMLFLRHIGDIEYCGLENNDDIGIHKSVMGDEFVTISSNDSVSMWIVTDYDFDIPAEIHELMQNDKLVPNKLKNAQRSRMSFATLIYDSSIKPIDDSALFCYLPTKVCEFGFPFLVNADFLTTASRESIHYKNIWNQFLFGQIGKLIVQWAIHLSNYNGYLNFLPEKLLSENNPLAEYFNDAYKSALESEAFILNHKGELSKKSEIIIDKTGLYKIIGPDLFCWLLKTDKCLPSEMIDCGILECDLFGIEPIDLEVNILDAITHNPDFSKWFDASTNEQKELLFNWIKRENDSQEKNEKLVSFVSSLPLFQFGDEFKAFDGLDDGIIITDKNIVIKSILQKLGFSCSDNVFDDKHPLYEFIKPQDKKLLFDRIKECDFSQLDLAERRALFLAIESDYFEGIGEAKIKELALFKNMNDELKPLCEMVAYEESPNWLKPYVLNKEENFDELSKYLITKEKQFEDVVWEHKNEFPGTPYELYNTYKWTDEKYTRQLINELKETDAFCGLISLVEESSKDTQKHYLQSISRVELTADAKYGKGSYEYRVLQIALAVYDDPTVFSSKVFYDGKCIKDCSVKDNVVCEYTQNGETKEVCFSLTKLLPNYLDQTSSIEQVKLLFEGNGETIEKFFDLKSKTKFEVYRELKGYLFEEYKYRTNKYSKSYGTYSTTVTECRWLIIPSIEQYLFVSMYGNNKQLKQSLRLDENDCAELIDLLYKNGKVQINSVPFVDFFYENHVKNKCFYNDYILESERLYKSIELWADDESKKQYLIKNGVKTSSSHVIRFRQLFLEDKVIDFIGEIKDEDLESGMEFIATADGYSRPFEGENQEKTLKHILKEKKCKELIDKWDLDKMVEVAHEWNSPEYNKWKEDHSLKIELYPKKMPHQLFYNNTLVLNYESGHKYYDSSNQRLFISEDNIQKTLLGIIDDPEIPFSSEDYAFLFSVISKDDYDTLKDENERLREEVRKLRQQLDNKTDGTTTLLPESCGQGMGSVDIEGVDNVPDLGIGPRIDAQIEAQKALRQKAELNNWGWTFPDSFGTEDCYSTFEVQDKNSNPIPIVLKSYKDRSKPFKITPEEWDYIFEYEAEIYVYTSLNGFSCDFVKINKRDLIKGQNVSLQFNVENLEIEDRISSLSESLHYFKELHFNFDNFIVPKNAPIIEDIYNRTNGDKQPETNDDDLK